jgi:hypothetical protein
MESEPLAVVKKGDLGEYLVVLGGKEIRGKWFTELAAHQFAEGLISAVESREKVLRDRITSLESELSKAKDRVTQLVAEVVDLWGTDTEKLSWIKDRERAAFERAKERAAKITCEYCRSGMTPIESNKVKGQYGHYFPEQGTEEVCGPDADAIRELRFEEGK